MPLPAYKLSSPDTRSKEKKRENPTLPRAKRTPKQLLQMLNGDEQHTKSSIIIIRTASAQTLNHPQLAV
jgi:hypothetical protein